MVRLRPLLPVAALAASLAAPAAAPAAPKAHDARLTGTFPLSGRVTVADHVRGEHRGQRVKRRWTFTSSCPGGVCSKVELRRRRSSGRSELVTLRRIGKGRYTGTARFFVRLRCHGRVYPRGGVAPYRLTVRIIGSRTVQTTPFATRISATYRNATRTNRTPCPGGIGRDAADYGGRLATVPGPPAAAFTYARADVLTPTFAFTDGSKTGAGGARIVAQAWSFGDPASGTADAATGPAPRHRFITPGTHVVTLTVRDANGLTGATQRTVTP